MSLNETQRLGEEAAAGECHGLIILSRSGYKLFVQKQDLLSQLAASVVSLSAHVIAIGIPYSLVLLHTECSVCVCVFRPTMWTCQLLGGLPSWLGFGLDTSKVQASS